MVGRNYRYIIGLFFPILLVSAEGLNSIMIMKFNKKIRLLFVFFIIIYLLLVPLIQREHIFSQQYVHKKYLLYKNVSNQISNNCLIFKEYVNSFDNAFIVLSITHKQTFDPSFFKQKHISILKSFQCKKLLIETNNELINEYEIMKLGKNFILGNINKTFYNPKNNISISVYDLFFEELS